MAARAQGIVLTAARSSSTGYDLVAFAQETHVQQQLEPASFMWLAQIE